MSEPKSPIDARLDELFQAAREAPIAPAPAFERVRRRRASAIPRWAAGWALLPLIAGAAAGSYVVVKQLAAPKEVPAPAPAPGPVKPRIVEPKVNAELPEPPPPAPPVEAVAPPPVRCEPMVKPPPPPPAEEKPVASRLEEAEPEPAPPAPSPQLPAVGGPPSTLAEQANLVRSGYDALKAGRAADARARFDEYQRRFPSGTLEAEVLLGSIRADQALGQFARALPLIERALQIAPERRAELLVLQGELLLADGRRDEAKESFDRALALGLSPELLERATRGRSAAAQ